MRGLKNTQIAGTVLTRFPAASLNASKRPIETPPGSRGAGPGPMPELGGFSGSPKRIDPVTPTVNASQFFPEKGNEKLCSATCGSVIFCPKSASHSSGKFSTRYPRRVGVKRRLCPPRSNRFSFPSAPSSSSIKIKFPTTDTLPMSFPCSSRSCAHTPLACRKPTTPTTVTRIVDNSKRKVLLLCTRALPQKAEKHEPYLYSTPPPKKSRSGRVPRGSRHGITPVQQGAGALAPTKARRATTVSFRTKQADILFRVRSCTVFASRELLWDECVGLRMRGISLLIRSSAPARIFVMLGTRHFLLPCRTLDVSNLPKDSSMTTPAHSVPASKLARSARSDEIVAKHKKYLWPSVTNYFQQPLVADRGEMQYIWDLDGNKYLDFFGGILTVSVGHCNSKVSGKVAAQVNRLQHTSTLYPNEHIVALAEKIAHITPGNLKSSFFTNSGTEANEAAILLARMSTGNFDVVALRHAYSGGSSLAKAVTAHAPYRKAGVISVGISHAVNPYCYRCPLHLKYPDCEVACAGDVENLIQTGTSGNIAAFIAEPIQGVGGFITPPKEYFKIVFKIVKQYGALIISDEVQTGWGRTGKKWFGIEQWEVVPDMITSAKGMANGVPIGLTVTTPEIAGSFQGANIATFGGNPVTSVAAKATIELIEEENLLENAHIVGAHFRSKLEELQQKHALIGDVRGMGLMQALELVKDRKTKEPAAEDTAQVMERARQNGLLIGKGGLYGNVLRLAPMLNTSKSDVDEAVRLLDKSFTEVRN